MWKRVWDFLTRADTLWTLGSAVTGTSAFAWLGQQWGWLASQGWAAVLLVSVALMAVVMTAATGVYWIFRTARAGSAAQHLDLTGDRSLDEPIAGNVTAHGDCSGSEFDPRGLYIGNIDIDHRLVGERRVLTIMVSGFNASGCSIDIREVRGGIGAKVRKIVYTPSATFEDELDFGEMLSPSIGRWLCDLTDIQDLSEFFLKIIQNVPANMLNEIQETDWQRRIALDFKKLDVMVYPTDSSREGCRLPLWSGTNFHLSSAEWVKVHKVVSVSPAPAGARAGAGLGSG